MINESISEGNLSSLYEIEPSNGDEYLGRFLCIANIDVIEIKLNES